MIRLEGVEKSYGQTPVLQGVNLSVPGGDFVAIMGSSGSGKSTLLNLVGGMDIPDRGRVLVHGKDISSLSDEKLTLYRRQKIGFIFQSFNLLPNLTVYQNIEIPLLLNGAAGYGEKIADILRWTGLEGREQDPPHQLSGGEQQRVAIARALIHEPEIILADEPTGNLDSRTGQAIMELIQNAARQTGKTVLLVTHDPAIARFSHRTITIEDGRLQT